MKLLHDKVLKSFVVYMTTWMLSFVAVRGQHMSFKCGTMIYICSNKVTKDTMCPMGKADVIKKGNNKDCATLRQLVKTLKRPKVFQSKCPNGKKMSYYVTYNKFGLLGKKFNKDGMTMCKGAHCGGDPHFITYDGTGYDYHGQCDLVMAHTTNLVDTGLSMDIHARTKIVTDWSYMSNVAIRIGTDVIEATSDGSLLYNGHDVSEYPFRMADRFNVSRIDTEVFPNQYRIDYMIDLEHASEENGDDNIRISAFKNMLSINVDTILPDTYGMLGSTNQDGLYGRDLVTPIGDDVTMMGQEWQVRDDEPHLFHDMTSSPQYPERCFIPSHTKMRRLRHVANDDHNDEVTRKAKEACADVQDHAMQSFCIQDVIVTGDYEYAGLYHGH